MKELVLSLILSITNQAGLDMEVGYIKLPNNSEAVAQHGISKSGKNYILVNERTFARMDDEKQLNIIVHEMAHALVMHDHNEKSLKHKAKWKRACYKLVDMVEGADRNIACQKEG